MEDNNTMMNRFRKLRDGLREEIDKNPSINPLILHNGWCAAYAQLCAEYDALYEEHKSMTAYGKEM